MEDNKLLLDLPRKIHFGKNNRELSRKLFAESNESKMMHFNNYYIWNDFWTLGLLCKISTFCSNTMSCASWWQKLLYNVYQIFLKLMVIESWQQKSCLFINRKQIRKTGHPIALAATFFPRKQYACASKLLNRENY